MDIFSEIFFAAVILIVCAFFLKPVRGFWVLFIDTCLSKVSKSSESIRKMDWVLRELPAFLIASFAAILLASYGGHDVSYIFVTAILAWMMAYYLDSLPEPARKAIYVGTGILICAFVINLNPSSKHHQDSFLEDEYATYDLIDGYWNLSENTFHPCKKMLEMAYAAENRETLFATSAFQSIATTCHNLDFATVQIKRPKNVPENPTFSPLIADE